jgi:hypothetical protein
MCLIIQLVRCLMFAIVVMFSLHIDVREARADDQPPTPKQLADRISQLEQRAFQTEQKLADVQTQLASQDAKLDAILAAIKGQPAPTKQPPPQVTFSSTWGPATTTTWQPPQMLAPGTMSGQPVTLYYVVSGSSSGCGSSMGAGASACGSGIASTGSCSNGGRRGLFFRR